MLTAGTARAQSIEEIGALIEKVGKVGKPGDKRGGGSKALDALRIAATIAALEARADRSGLPVTPLSLQPAARPGDLTTADSDLYVGGVPRLVGLMNRAEADGAGVGEEAGSVLAEINAAEHVTPEIFKPNPIRARDFTALRSEYADFFANAALRPEREEIGRWHLAALQQFRDRYERVAAKTGVPWHVIGVIHGLEASYNFKAHLHNGDYPLSRRTRQVPAGRPKTWLPPDDWESSAIDALRLIGFTTARDWSLERTLWRFEAYNGFGYRRVGVPTPYLWSFSTIYESGKFVSDGSFDAKARSKQCGAGVALKLLTEAGTINWG